MLEFAEKTLLAIKSLRKQTEELIVNGNVKDMEQYRFLMGRLEGYKFVELEIQHLLSKNPDF
jgi:hypothetical protein